METIYFKIAERINQCLTGIALIDEDTGQLQPAEGDAYPLTFPCVLISIPTIDWSTTSNGAQVGEAFFTVKLAFDCYDDIHLSSDPWPSIVARDEKNTLLCLALPRHVIGNSPLIGSQIRQIPKKGIIKGY